MQVVHARQPFPEGWSAAIFLAGPTPRAHKPVPSWRKDALEILTKLGYRGVVFVPEDTDGQPWEDYDAQIDWETEGLQFADIIVFWVPRDLETLPGFTTNVEFGSWLPSGKCVLGYPPGAPKMRYLDAHYQKVMGQPAQSTLQGTLEQALARIGDGAWRSGAERQVPLHLWKRAKVAHAGRWALDWAWVGVVTGGLAPLPASWLVIGLPGAYFWTAGVLGGASGLLVGLVLCGVYRALPARNRVAVLGVLAPLPLGAWGAGVATAAAWWAVPQMMEFAPIPGSLSALLQMLWFVPVYTALVERGRQWLPVLLATVLAPGCGVLAVIGFLSLLDLVQGW